MKFISSRRRVISSIYVARIENTIAALQKRKIKYRGQRNGEKTTSIPFFPIVVLAFFNATQRHYLNLNTYTTVQYLHYLQNVRYYKFILYNVIPYLQYGVKITYKFKFNTRHETYATYNTNNTILTPLTAYAREKIASIASFTLRSTCFCIYNSYRFLL